MRRKAASVGLALTSRSCGFLSGRTEEQGPPLIRAIANVLHRQLLDLVP